jgi:hypothetical protein
MSIHASISKRFVSLHLVYLQRLPGGWWGTGRVGNTRSIGSPYMDKSRLRAFLKTPSARKAGELHNLSRNQLRIMTGLLLKSFWVVARRQFLVYNQRFGNTCLSHLQGLKMGSNNPVIILSWFLLRVWRWDKQVFPKRWLYARLQPKNF